ncbi:Hypothetical predicted protein [Mytilus galloprovincialis]|uniref:Uncharacterized protein n=1 Tax=Mytilus galloprovincialis TaxID=29158 RepID=A0A8B6CFT1_MYTGA|nr:Hypothetical predicted protein [Mytilus galloprovincialis]
MVKRTKKDRDKVENMAPTKQAVHKKTIERIGPRSQTFQIEYDTVEYVDRTGNELLANWKCSIQEKEEAIQTTSKKLQNMQPSKLSENRLRQEIEQWIDFKEADRHVMKRCLHNLQISMKDRLHYLRKQKHFFLDKQKTLKNVYKTIERSNRSRIPNPFPQFILDVKREHYQLFNKELLISPNGSLNKYKRQMIEANSVIIDDTTLYIGRTGRTNVMTPIHDNILESDKCITGECVDSCCTLRRSESELSFLNHEFEIEYNMFELSMDSNDTENCSRNDDIQRNEPKKHAKRSKIPVPVKLPQLLANKKMKYEDKSPSTPVKLPLLLPTKKMKYAEETLKHQLPNKKIIYPKEISDTTVKLPPLLPDKEKTCMQENPFTNRPGTPKLLPPLQNLPQNIKKTLIVNKIRYEKKDKSEVMSTESMSKPAPQQPAEATASNDILDMSPQLDSKRPKWKSQYRTFKLQKTSGKNYYASNRKYRFSRLHLSSGKKCYIPKSNRDTVSKMVYERYCTKSKQNWNVGKQTDREKPDRYPEQDRIHTLPRNMREIYILNEKKEKSKVVSAQSTSLSAPQKTAETTANGGTLDMNSELALKRVKWENKFPTFRLQKGSGQDCHISERKYRFSRLHKSSVKNCFIPKSKSDKVSKIVTEKYCTTRTQKRNVKKQTELERPDSYPTPDQINTWPQNLKNILILKNMRNEKKEKSEVVKSMTLSAPQYADETKTSNKKSKPAPEQTDETTASHKMSKSAQQQVDMTTDSNKMSEPAQPQTVETTASNKMYKSTQEHADRTTTWSDNTRNQNRIIREQKEREKSVNNLEQDQYHSMMDYAVDDKYPTEDIIQKLDDNELIGFYQVQEKDLFPVIENMSDSKVIEVFKKLHDQHIAVIHCLSDSVDDTQSSSSGSTINDFQDAGENGGTLKSTMKTFAKNLIPDCITNGSQCQPTETLSSNWQIIKVLPETNIKTQYIPMQPTQFIPMPPNSPKPKTSNARRKRYGRKGDENNNPPES